MSTRIQIRRAVSVGLMVIAVLLAAAKAARAAPVEPICHPEWSEATAVIEREGLASAKGVDALARRHTGGALVRITLCEQAGGAFVYRLLLRDAQGRVVALTVDARHPFAEATAGRAGDLAEAARQP